MLTLALLLGLASAQTAPSLPTTPTPSAPAPITAQTVPASGAALPAPEPLSLSQVLARLTAAPQVTQANLALERAQRDLNAAQAGLSLNVTVGGNASYSSAAASSAALGSATGLSGSLNLKATAGVLPWASNQAALFAAQRSLNYAKAVRLENISSARVNAAQQYQSAYLAQLDVAVAAQNLTSAQQVLAAAQVQRRQQNATAESVLQAQAALQTAQASQAAAQTNLDTARRSLSATLGTSLDTVKFVSAPSLPLNLDASGLAALGLGDVGALVTQALATSSSVVQAQNTLASAQDALAQQQRDRSLPDLTLSASYGPGGSGLTAGLSLKDGTANAGYTQSLGQLTGSSSAASSLTVSLSGSYAVYSPAATAQIASTQAQVSQAQLSLTLARQTAELDLRQKYSDALTALGAVSAKATLEERARVALQTAQARLAAGTAIHNDVTAAQVAFAQAQRDTQAARSAAALTLFKLQAAAGQPVAGGLL